jgi:hypothetical protein
MLACGSVSTPLHLPPSNYFNRRPSSSNNRLIAIYDEGKILNLGADWRLTDVNGKYRPDARYIIQADDGTHIYVQTEGPTLEDGRSLLRGKFETGTTGTYAWLNDVVAVGVLNRSGDKVFIDMWQVSYSGDTPHLYAAKAGDCSRRSSIFLSC